jgi:hypothetical protein
MEAVEDGTLEDIDSIARRLGAGRWDVALVGDGAGRGWSKPAGWACILIDRHGGGVAADGTVLDARKLFSGGVNLGTCNIAELMPYVHPMLWYDRYLGRSRRDQLRKEVLDVLVITDNKTIVAQGGAIQEGRDRVSEVCRKQPTWAIMFQFERIGYRFTWAWQERNKVALNAVADRMADAAKHAAANALSQAVAHIRTDLPDSPSEEELIYMFNHAAFDTPIGARPRRRKKYGKPTRSDEAGFDPVDTPG